MRSLLLVLCLAGPVAVPLRAETPVSDQTSFTAKKDSYQKKIEKDLNKLSGKIEDLRRRSQKAGADTRAKADSDLDILQKDLDAARKKAAHLSEQTTDDWEKFRKGLDETVADLKKSYHKVKEGL